MEQHNPDAKTRVTEIDLPESLTTPLPADASPVAVIARTAAETALGVHGVHRLGGLVARAADRVREQLGRAAGTAGVQVDDDGDVLDVTVAIVVEYPEEVTAVADKVRTQVHEAVKQLRAGPASITVRVIDVHGPFDDVEPEVVTNAKEAVATAKDVVTERAADAKEAVASIAANAKDALSDVAATAKEAAANVADNAKDVADDVRDAAADAVDSAADHAATAADHVEDGTDDVKKVAADAKDDIADAAADAKESITDAAADAHEAATEAATDAKEAVTQRAAGAKEAVAERERTEP